METFPTADSADSLYDILSTKEHAPDVATSVCERLIALAQERTQMRGESPFEQQKDYLFTTEWLNMARDKLGEHNDRVNQFALGVPQFDKSKEKNAYFVDDAVVPQWGWLESGDGRMSYVEPVDLTDTDFHDTPRKMWWPKDYTVVIEFTDTLVKSDAGLADAM